MNFISWLARKIFVLFFSQLRFLRIFYFFFRKKEKTENTKEYKGKSKQQHSFWS